MSLVTPGYSGHWGEKKKEGGIGKIIKENIKLIAVAIIILAIIGFIFLGGIPSIPGGEVTLGKAQVLKICGHEPITQDFVTRNPSYQSEITFLNSETLEELALASPAIYADLPRENGLYKVRYAGQEEGILLLLDPKSKNVLKYYRVRTLAFP